MAGGQSSEEKALAAVVAAEDATVDQVAAAAGIGRTSARKYLAALEEAGRVRRFRGGREGKRKLPDRFSPAGRPPATPTVSGRGGRENPTGRLRPGGLDRLVLAYLREHDERGPLGPSAVAKGLARSSGAVANCLERLASKGQEVKRVGQRPRRYRLEKG